MNFVNSFNTVTRNFVLPITERPKMNIKMSNAILSMSTPPDILPLKKDTINFENRKKCILVNYIAEM